MDLDDEELFYTRLKNGSMSKKEMIKKVEEYLDKLSKLDIEKDQTKEKDLMQRLEALRKEMENEQER